MIVYIDIEHPGLQTEPVKWKKHISDRLKIRARLEDLAGEPCQLIAYRRISRRLVEDLNPKAIFISGNSSEWHEYAEHELAEMVALLRDAHRPIFGFCGGLQLLASAHGATLGPMGPAGPDDPLPPPELNSAPGMRQERGFMPIRITAPHPLFAGLDEEPVFYQSHYWEVKTLPAGFQACAETDLCRVQVLVHEDAPLFGTQFHPEIYDEVHLDGRSLLKNFFDLVGVGVKSGDDRRIPIPPAWH